MSGRAGPEARIRADLHCHTRYSVDCRTDLADLLRTAERRGVHRLAITDHDAIAGALRLHEMDPQRIIVGEEVKTAEGFDVIGLFLTDLIPSRTPAEEACLRIREQGGVVYIPHAFDVGRSGAGSEYLERLAPLIDLVEVHNSRCWHPAANARARRWAAESGKIAGAGSDAHTLAEVGAGSMLMPPFEHERESFLAAAREADLSGCVRTSPVFRLASIYARGRNLIAGRRK